MPRFIVTKCVDAFVNHVAVVDAADRTQARRVAIERDCDLVWQEAGTSEFDHVDFDNVEPEQVADDFALGESEAETMAGMRAALEAAEHWLMAEKRGADTGTKPEEILRVIRAAIARGRR